MKQEFDVNLDNIQSIIHPELLRIWKWTEVSKGTRKEIILEIHSKTLRYYINKQPIVFTNSRWEIFKLLFKRNI